jgi:hypothetical protein
LQICHCPFISPDEFLRHSSLLEVLHRNIKRTPSSWQWGSTEFFRIHLLHAFSVYCGPSGIYSVG